MRLKKMSSRAMHSDRVDFAREDLVKLLSEEKEALSKYQSLCARFLIDPNQTAISVSKARMDMLEMFLAGKLRILK